MKNLLALIVLTSYMYASPLWIMSRTPKVNEEKLQNILTLLEGNMDLKRLIYTPQDTQGRYK